MLGDNMVNDSSAHLLLEKYIHNSKRSQLNLMDFILSGAWERITRRWLWLLKYNFSIEHPDNANHQTSDACSRHLSDGCDKIEMKHDISVIFIHDADFGKHICPSHVIEDLECTVMHAELPANACMVPTYVEFIMNQGEEDFCLHVAKQNSRIYAELSLKKWSRYLVCINTRCLTETGTTVTALAHTIFLTSPTIRWSLWSTLHAWHYAQRWLLTRHGTGCIP